MNYLMQNGSDSHKLFSAIIRVFSPLDAINGDCIRYFPVYIQILEVYDRIY